MPIRVGHHLILDFFSIDIEIIFNKPQKIFLIDEEHYSERKVILHMPSKCNCVTVYTNYNHADHPNVNQMQFQLRGMDS